MDENFNRMEGVFVYYLNVVIIKPKFILKSLSKEGEAGMNPFVL